MVAVMCHSTWRVHTLSEVQILSCRFGRWITHLGGCSGVFRPTVSSDGGSLWNVIKEMQTTSLRVCQERFCVEFRIQMTESSLIQGGMKDGWRNVPSDDMVFSGPKQICPSKNYETASNTDKRASKCRTPLASCLFFF